MTTRNVFRSIALCMALCVLLVPHLAFAQARLVADLPDLGNGLSGLEVTHKGTRFVAITDRGQLLHGTISRAAGVPVRADVTERYALTRADGAPAGDSEGLAVLRDGSLVVSYEGTPPAILRHGRDGVGLSAYPTPPGFSELADNSGPEALAVGPDGSLYVIPEKWGRMPVWRLSGGVWRQIATLKLGMGFRVVGADIGPDGALYVLERSFAGFAFASQIRRVPLDGQPAEVLLGTPLGTHGNLEGVSIWRDADGQMRATMVEDNNGLAFLGGGLVEYILPAR